MNNSTRHRSKISQRELFDQDHKVTCIILWFKHFRFWFFSSLQCHVAKIKEFGDLYAIVNTMNFALRNYDACMLELVWQALFNIMNSVLIANNGNDFLISHQGTRKVQQAGMLECCDEPNCIWECQMHYGQSRHHFG